MKKMRKLLLALLTAAILIASASCAANKPNGGETSGEITSGKETTAGDTSSEETTAEEPKNIEDMSPSDIMKKILDGVKGLPEVWEIELTAENFPAYAFTDYKDEYQAVCSEAMMNITTHSVVLIQVPDGEDAAAVADSVRENANPNKWVCVSADKVVVRQYGNNILLVMSYEQLANQIVSNFDALYGKETPAEDRYVPETTVESASENIDSPILY